MSGWAKSKAGVNVFAIEVVEDNAANEFSADLLNEFTGDETWHGVNFICVIDGDDDELTFNVGEVIICDYGRYSSISVDLFSDLFEAVTS